MDDEMTIANTKSNQVSTINSPSRLNVYKMFDRIAGRYDLLNHLLSCGCDIRWRNKAVSLLPEGEHLKVLDLACGTADLAMSAAKRANNISQIVGVDLASEMLKLGDKKVAEDRLSSIITMVRGDGLTIPIRDNSLDAVMIAFGIRNMPDTKLCLQEIRRVLKVRGKLIVLEFSLPSNRLIRFFYLLYFRNVLPLLGKLISGDSFAYSYLNRTVETYYQAEEFTRVLIQAGFCKIAAKPLTFGVATIYVGVKGDL